ncbi:hypothetical protein HUU39_11600 [candidate division KSB1 bacterium]|nr:hypothetical protein [bacterium]NUM65902.1 hypothetical protein [candidate division KSB1 bacterium]
MKPSESIDMKGRLTLQKRNAAGELVEQVAADNSIMLSGRELVARMFIHKAIDPPIDPISYVAVGTGTTAVDPANTQLQTELFRKPINTIDPTQHVTTTSDKKIKLTISAELDFNEANGALTEAGLFNAANAGVMYNRVVFDPINKSTDFKLTLIWEIVF